MAKRSFLPFLSLPLLLSSCSLGGGSSSASHSPSQEPISEESGVESASSEASGLPNASEEAKVTSLKQGLEYVNKNKNYSLSYRSASSGECILAFTEKAIGFYASLAPEADFAYVEDEGGVYRVSFDDGYVAGEYLRKEDGDPITDVWDGSAYKTLFGVGDSFLKGLDEGAKEVEITDKTYKLNFLLLAGFARTDYTTMKGLSAAIDDEGKITFALAMEKVTVHYVLGDLGTTSCLPADYYLADFEGPLELPEDLTALRENFLLSNFRRAIYSFDTESFIGHEYFLPRYFLSHIPSASSQTGYMALENEDLGLKGVYMFSLDSQGRASFLGRPMYEEPDMVSFMHYPCLMKLWENMEFVHYGELDYAGYEYEGTPYYVTRPEIVYDFVTNNSIDVSFPISTYTPLALGIDLVYGEEDFRANLVYYFKNGSEVAVMPNPFDLFGSANIKSLDSLVDYYDSYVAEENSENR